MEIFRALGVQLKGLDGSVGSGCIVQTKEKKYVLTAQHCLTNNPNKKFFSKEEKKKLEIINSSGDKIKIINVHVPEKENLDFAVIEVQDFKDYPEILIDTPKTGTRYKFFGFPDYLNNDIRPGDSLDGYFSEVLDDTLILQHAQGPFSDADKDAKDNIVGFSGSGIYKERDGSYFLIGILTSLRGDGEHGKSVGININFINSFLEINNLPKIIHSRLDDFDLYFSDLISQEGETNAAILSKVFKDNFEGVSPYYLSELLNEKITIPYDENFNSFNEEIWKGWIQLLLYISFYKKEKITHENLQDHIYLSEKSKSKNNLFYTEDPRIQKFIRNLYKYAYEDLCKEAIVFVNSKDIRINRPIDAKRIKSIVTNIAETDTIFFEKGIDITNPIENKKIIVVPISYILAELEEVLVSCDLNRENTFEVERKCREKTKDLFNEFTILLEMEEEHAAD